MSFKDPKIMDFFVFESSRRVCFSCSLKGTDFFQRIEKNYPRLYIWSTFSRVNECAKILDNIHFSKIIPFQSYKIL